MSSVMVVDGLGVSMSVHRSRLIIEDGMGTSRRHREVSRIERAIRRIVVLTDSGTVTLEAVRWCASVGIALVALDGDGRPLGSAAAPGKDDARLRRAQAVAPSRPVGLQIIRALLGAKLSGQANLTRGLLGQDRIAEHLEDLATQLETADGLLACRDLEAQAASVYFSAWAARVNCQFAEQQGSDVPKHWHRFTARRSVIGRSPTPRTAADPINAILSYGYGLAEIECRLAALTVGLDPGMGILHTDKKNRDSLALDLLEAIRPNVEYNVLTLLATRVFIADDFYETRDGTCRLAPPLIDLLVDAIPGYATAVGPVAEGVAHALAGTGTDKIELRTPLTLASAIRAQSEARSAQQTPAPTTGPTPMPTCRSCGIELPGRRRELCPTCWAVGRNGQATPLFEGGVVQGLAAPGTGQDRAQSLQSRARRSQTLAARSADEAAWAAGGAHPSITREELVTSVVPQLKDITIRQLQEATGLSASGCSMIRSGKRTPHPRHWAVLAELVSSTAGS
jgi:CRISPR-associated endonuclease Cas1